ncbi:MAG: TIGR00730 family Rossman fold protein [Bacteroidetes bacterium]|nr:TIGR00730 family Rossman fold protein [Bacteroidota bacterium]
MNNICVFCGSSTGKDPVYRSGAAEFGKLLAKSGITLIYGGGKVGLMGILADNALAAGGKCIGIIPRSIADLEIAHDHLTELHIVAGMQERKAMMMEISDAFIALPGGLGTLDELAEVLTYNQLRIFDKPVGLLNINGYFNGLLQYFDHGVSERFIRQEHRNNILVSDDPLLLLRKMNDYQPVLIGKWIDEIKEESLMK